MTSRYSYDLVQFHSTCVPGADCRRLEVVARLFGVSATPCARARVLELGCGNAANLIPLALAYPEASFVGCDLSQSAVAAAQRMIERLDLKNVELRCADICDVDRGWGRFDYVLCHDVFSWVDPTVRQQILAVLRCNLVSHGVGYVSFDVLPGWNLHGVTRDLMRHHVASLASDPRQAVDQARGILAMAAAVQDQNRDAYAELIREEYFRASAIDDGTLYHMVFSEHHHPFHLHEFIREISKAGLQYLGDSDPTRWFGPREPAVVRAFLDALPRLEQQQYLDFLTNCASRGAVLCHGDLEILDRPDPSVLRHCWIGIATAARGDVVALDPLIEKALSRLEESRPAFVAFQDLEARGESATDFFMEAYAARRIDLALSPPSLTSRISDTPTVSPLVRLQSQDGSIVTNQKCEPVRLTDLARHVAGLLNGVHTRNEVSESVAREVQSGRIANDWIWRQGQDALDVDRLTGAILRHLRDRALLVA